MEEDTPEEKFYQYFSEFIRTLIVLSLSPDEIIVALGAKGLGERIWLSLEIRDGLLTSGRHLGSSEFSPYLSIEERNSIKSFVSLLEILPKSALDRNPEKALNDKAWDEIRKQSSIVYMQIRDSVSKYRNALSL